VNNQFHFTPEGYLELMHEEVPRYDELQEQVAAACAGVDAPRILELGTGTGETAQRVLAAVPRARIVGLDESPPMLEQARSALPADRVEDLVVARLEDPLPLGPFGLVFTALAVHHLDAAGKRDLFERVRAVLERGGRFVLADVFVPEDPGDAVTPIEEGFDLPDRLDDQLDWLAAVGFEPRIAWSWKDCAVIAADAA
jgi:tRNA (cmo5U34)-methyltransferase